MTLNPASSVPTPVRVVVATPLPADLAERIRTSGPGIDLVYRPDLQPPMRFPADFSGDPAFERTPEQRAEFVDLLRGADVLYGIPDLDSALLAEVIRDNPALSWVQIMAAGGGGQVKAAGLTATELDRVRFTTSAGVHGGPLAEFAVFGVLAGAKTLPRLLRQQRAHEWSSRWEMAQVSEQTVLVVGLGGIGAEVARKLDALGAHVIGTSRHGDGVPGVAEVVHPDTLAEVLPRVDAIVLTLPGTAATERMFGAELFAAVKPGVTIVNVGRGVVIDEDALLPALRDGRVGFAALDVTAVEPLPEASPLWDEPNVLLSPHTAALNSGEERRIAELFIANLRAFRAGEPMRNVVDTVEFY